MNNLQIGILIILWLIGSIIEYMEHVSAQNKYEKEIESCTCFSYFIMFDAILHSLCLGGLKILMYIIGCVSLACLSIVRLVYNIGRTIISGFIKSLLLITLMVVKILQVFLRGLM